MRLFRLCAPLPILLLTVPVWAADAPAYSTQPVSTVKADYDPDAWIVTLKGNAVVSPKWSGSDQLSFIAYPSLSIRRPWTPPVWYSPDDGIDYALIEQKYFSFGPVVRYRGGRYSGSEGSLYGLHDAKWTVEGGAFVNVWAIPDLLRARLEVRRGFRGEDGFVADLGLDLVQTFGKFTVAVGPRLSLADGNFMRNQYGVTAQDALANGRVNAYRPEGGLRAAGAYASVNYQINPAWGLIVHGGYERLIGDAGKSPIVRNLGSRDQFTFGATATYSFDWKWSGLKF